MYELWTFTEEGAREVHLFSRVQISDDFIRKTFHTHFFNAEAVQIPFLDRRSVNGSVQWIDVPRSFCKLELLPCLVLKIYMLTPGVSVDSPARSPDNPINLRAVACHIREDLLQANCVERFQTLS